MTFNHLKKTTLCCDAYNGRADREEQKEGGNKAAFVLPSTDVRNTCPLHTQGGREEPIQGEESATFHTLGTPSSVCDYISQVPTCLWASPLHVTSGTVLKELLRVEVGLSAH